MMDISENTKIEILDFVNSIFPSGGDVWLTGSRAIGKGKPNSDWDVLVVSKHCPKKREDIFNIATQKSQFLIDGGPIEAVCIHPDVLASDPRRYFVDCRKHGIRLQMNTVNG